MRLLLTLAAVVGMSLGLTGCSEKKEATKPAPAPKIELGKGAKENTAAKKADDAKKEEPKKEEPKKEEPKKEEAAKSEEKPAPPPEEKKEEPKAEEKK